MGPICCKSGARLILKNATCEPQAGLSAAEFADENQYFAEILPILLSTVSQQFLHMLILRRLAQPALEARIKEVDDTDFVSAMQVIELLVTREFQFVIPSHRIGPGACIASIISAESESERVLNTSLVGSAAVKTNEGLLVIDRLKKPRDSYRHWLASKASRLRQEEEGSGTRKAVRALVSQCLNLMEQAMLDAFVFWAANNKKAANTSWRISGAAMLYITAIANLCGSVQEGINIQISSSQPRNESEQAEAEKLLVNRCLKMAHSAAYCCPDQAVTKTLLKIAADCERLARLRSDPTTQLSLGYSKIFSDFEKALNRMHP